MAGAALVWSLPLLVRRAFDTPDWYQPARGAEMLVLMGVAVVLTLTGLSTLSLFPQGNSESRWRRAMAPALIGVLALAVVLVTSSSSGDWLWSIRSLLDETVNSPSLLPVAAMLVVVADTLRRTQISVRDLTIRTAAASGVIWLVGVCTSALPRFRWSCLSPIVSAEFAACGVANGYAIRVLCGLIATGCVVSAIAVGGRPGRRLELLPLVGLAGWMASRTVVDLFTYHAALSLCPDGHLDPGEVTALARVASAVGVAGYGVAFGSWFIGAACFVARSAGQPAEPGAWLSIWPVLPVLILSTSAAFEPSLSTRFPQQTPEAVWNEVPAVEPITWAEEVGYIPFFMTRADNVVTGVLSREGELNVFRGGRQEHLWYGRVLSPPADHFWTDGVELVVDRQATLGDLRLAARSLRQSAGLSIVWRSNDLHDASANARARWGFVEMAGRALRARRIDLIAEPEHCDEGTIGSGPTVRRRCAVDQQGDDPLRPGAPNDVLLIESSNDVLIREWLVANAGTEDGFALVVSKDLTSSELATSVGGSDLPADPLLSRVGTPDLPTGLGVGIIFGILGTLVGILREFAVMRRLVRRGSTSVPPQEGPRRAHPSWVRWQLATLRVLVDGTGGPYRAHAEMTVADEATAWRELRRVAKGAATGSLHGTMRWVFLAVVACVVGFGLPLLIPG